MTETIWLAAFSLIGTLCGTFGGIMTSNKLTGYRIEQLEKKVDQLEQKLDSRVSKLNDVYERIYRLEDSDKLLDQRITQIEKRGA